ncbi:putative FAS1 domain-containing protein [Helianthus annuus]|nr:putative FAS1 domain-containing protein [Helianthus annuus]
MTSSMASSVSISTVLLLTTVINAVVVTAVPDREYHSMLAALRFRGYHLFANAITTTDLHYDIINGDNFTFFAPIDSALYALDMTLSAGDYTTVLRFHCVPHRLTLTDLRTLFYGSNSVTSLVPGHEIHVMNPLTLRSPIMIEGVDIAVPGLFYGAHVAVHGLEGVMDFRSLRDTINSSTVTANLTQNHASINVHGDLHAPSHEVVDPVAPTTVHGHSHAPPHRHKVLDSVAPATVHSDTHAPPHKHKVLDPVTPMAVHGVVHAPPHKHKVLNPVTPTALHGDVHAPPHKHKVLDTVTPTTVHSVVHAPPHKHKVLDPVTPTAVHGDLHAPPHKHKVLDTVTPTNVHGDVHAPPHKHKVLDSVTPTTTTVHGEVHALPHKRKVLDPVTRTTVHGASPDVPQAHRISVPGAHGYHQPEIKSESVTQPVIRSESVTQPEIHFESTTQPKGEHMRPELISEKIHDVSLARRTIVSAVQEFTQVDDKMNDCSIEEDDDEQLNVATVRRGDLYARCSIEEDDDEQLNVATVRRGDLYARELYTSRNMICVAE